MIVLSLPFDFIALKSAKQWDYNQGEVYKHFNLEKINQRKSFCTSLLQIGKSPGIQHRDRFGRFLEQDT